MQAALGRQAPASGIAESSSRRRCRTRIFVGEKLVEHLPELLIIRLISRTMVPGSLPPGASLGFHAVSRHFQRYSHPVGLL